MSKKYTIEVRYEVVESIDVEADDIDAAEEKALELLELGATGRNIVSDTSEEAEIYSSHEVKS